MIRLLALCLVASLSGCLVEPPPCVRVAISVDWEGRKISPVNLQAFATLRAAHPEVPLTHFLNAAYFTKPDANSERVSEQMRQVVMPMDEVGLHIHPWQSLVEAAGVTFRREPTIWGRDRPMRVGARDSGHEISVEAYETDEFQAIVAKSKEILLSRGFSVGASFRAGAWLAGPHVREAIRREGFLIDSSATDTKWHDELAAYQLPALMRAIWPDITSETQPFIINTPAGDLLEMPDTGALADYVTAEEMADHVGGAVARLGDEHDLFVHLGFHQETAARYAPRVLAAIRMIVEKHGDRVVFETLAASATRVIGAGGCGDALSSVSNR